jgi:hypothetical protein
VVGGAGTGSVAPAVRPLFDCYIDMWDDHMVAMDEQVCVLCTVHCVLCTVYACGVEVCVKLVWFVCARAWEKVGGVEVVRWVRCEVGALCVRVGEQWVHSCVLFIFLIFHTTASRSVK